MGVTTPRTRLTALAAAALLGGGLAASATPASAQDGHQGLPPGDGRDIVSGLCSGCHSIKLVQQQGMSRKRWDEMLVWMVEKQGMPELPPEMRTTVLDYLAEHYGEEQRRPASGGLSPYGGVQPLQPVE